MYSISEEDFKNKAGAIPKVFEKTEIGITKEKLDELLGNAFDSAYADVGSVAYQEILDKLYSDLKTL